MRIFRVARRVSVRGVRDLALEFVVVFLGVYLAFVFSDYQERLRAREIGLKYHDSLIAEFEALARHLDQEAATLEKHLQAVDAIERGETPAILLSGIGELYYLYRGSVVQAAFESQNFESLDLDMVLNIVEGTPLLEILEHRIGRLNELMRTVLPPLETSGEGRYYDPQGRLLPQLQWYPRLIREIHLANRTLHTVLVDDAIPDLQRTRTELEHRSVF
ncbi:MAG: hypothetical protein J4F37_02260 [Acidobacteria bacterium]|nr:hypothetical protein [Acidobacteriota bacterium]